MILSRLILGMIKDIDRPAICSDIPNKKSFSLMLDLGANVLVDASHLFQFALMGYSYFSIIDPKRVPKVRSNVRTTQAASSSLAEGLSVSFKAGAVTGMLVAGLALLSIAVYYYFLDMYAVDATTQVNYIKGLKLENTKFQFFCICS